jgi:hypothetical protein
MEIVGAESVVPASDTRNDFDKSRGVSDISVSLVCSNRTACDVVDSFLNVPGKILAPRSITRAFPASKAVLGTSARPVDQNSTTKV